MPHFIPYLGAGLQGLPKKFASAQGVEGQIGCKGEAESATGDVPTASV
ncbi:MAG: hypothetical protein GY938_26180 [Ketobacter sp.]|nr:hypothetical protein [Ketobacter sp.]